MRWSRIAAAGGLISVIFAFLGPVSTIADPRVAAPAGLGVGALVAIGLVIGSDSALGVAVAATGVAFAIGGIRGVSGAAWAAVAALVTVAGARLCFEARRPARVARGAQRAVIAGQLVAIAGIVVAAAIAVRFEDVGLARGWIIAGVAMSALPFFALRFVNRGRASPRPGWLRALAVAGVVSLLGVAVIGGAIAADRQRSMHTEESVESRSAIGERDIALRDFEAEPPGRTRTSVGEWLATIVSTVVVLTVLGLLASNWFREQPLEFRPANAIPGDGGPMITDQRIEDPLAMMMSTEHASGVLDAALRAIADVSDPRQAIRLAYSLVEDGFGDLAAGRRATESEAEYLRRVLPALGASASALRSLTSLFEVARFSEHLMTHDMRAAAIAALGELRSGVISGTRAGIEGLEGLEGLVPDRSNGGSS